MPKPQSVKRKLRHLKNPHFNLMAKWKHRGMKFKDRNEALLYALAATNPKTRCYVTGETNRSHKRRTGRVLDLDHCHGTKRPRGFVTSHINTLIGLMESLTRAQFDKILTTFKLRFRDE